MSELVLSPLAYLHWQFLNHAGHTEATAFGLPAADPLYVDHLWVPRQECSAVSTVPDEDAVADWCDYATDAGIDTSGGLVWLHTHPGDCPTPSQTDEKTFSSDLGRAAWAVMAILANGGQTYARLRWRIGRRAFTKKLEVRVAWEDLPAYAERISQAALTWEPDYLEKVREEAPRLAPAAGLTPTAGLTPAVPADDTRFAFWVWDTYRLDVDALQPDEAEELAVEYMKENGHAE